MLQLQGIAGNAAVSALLAGATTKRVVQRLAPGGAIPPPPVAPAPPSPAEHPGFRATQAKVTAAKRQATRHPPAAAKAAEAAKAAKPPADDKQAQAEAAKAGDMAAAPAGTFDKAAFIAAVSAAIAKAAPKNLDEADHFATSGKSDAVAAEVKGKVGQSKDASSKPMADASQKAPDTSRAKDKPVTPLPGPPAAGPLPAIDAASAMPAKAPAEQTELGGAPAETNQKMAEAEVTDEQLATSNEPEFTGALAAKKEGEQHSTTAPAAFRATEAQQLAVAQGGAQASGIQGAAALLGARGASMQQVGGAQQKTQTADETKRAGVTAKVKSIFDATKTAVDAILAGIDPQVDKQFTEGEAKAKAAFTAHHTARMDKYKDDRYSGLLGAGRWIKDKFADLPAEVNQFYEEAKRIYETQMRGVISDIADTVGRELTKAKERIASGRREITTYVDGLEPSLKSVGREAAKEIGSQFDSLVESVNDKSQSLVDDLAEKYVAARTAVDTEIKAMQEENKGLWSKAKDAIGGAIETILKLKNLLMGALARAAGAVSKIIKDPIGFLSNFVGAVKAGVMNFGSNILTHLKKGLQSWLFGTLAEAGIEIPEKFDLKGIVGLILSMLGLTWASIRARLAKVLPEWVLKALETAVEVVQILSTEGVSGLWKWIVQKISDLKEQVMSQIRDFVITKVITAGITWLISLLNPAAAFIKACKMIYDAVMWFVDNAERMSEFVNSVLDSVESIANGGVGKVAGLIEATLGKAIPMVISGLASLLGLGGIAEKIQKILESIQKPVGKVVDGIIAGVVKYGKKLLGKLKKKKKKGDDDTPEGKQKRLDDGLTAAAGAVNRMSSKFIPQAAINLVLAGIRIRYKMTSLRAVEVDKKWVIEGEVNPKGQKPTNKGTGSPAIDYKAPPATELAALGLDTGAIDRVFAKTIANQVQGQILEELAAKRHGAAAGNPAPAKTPGDSPTPQFIAPHLISSGGGSLTDGMTAILGTDPQGPYVEIISIVESKAGGEAKRELVRVREPWDKASAADKSEALAVVVEGLAGKEGAGLSRQDAKANVLAKYSADQLDYLAKRKFEGSEFLGQPAQNMERLAPNVDPAEGSSKEFPASVTINGVERRVKGFSRKGIAVEGVIPKGVTPGKTEKAVQEQGINFKLVEEHGITMDALRALAGRVADAAKQAKATS